MLRPLLEKPGLGRKVEGAGQGERVLSTNIYPSSVQFSRSVVSDSFVYHQLPELAHTRVHRVDDTIQPSHSRPLLLLPSIFPSIRDFPNESVLCIRWPKYWSFSFSISPSSGYWGLISFRIDWLDLLAVQGTLKSLVQHRSSKASVLWCSAFFILQFSYMTATTGKTIALTWQTFVDKITSLLFNMLSRLVIAFLPRSKCLLISWLQSPSAVILETKKIKSVTVSIVTPSICHEVTGLDAMTVFWVLSFKPAFSLSSNISPNTDSVFFLSPLLKVISCFLV